MGLLVMVTALGGLLIGLGVACVVVTVFTLVRGICRRGNILAFVLLAALGFLLALAATMLFNHQLPATTSGLPNYNNWFMGAFAIGCSPAGTALGLLALLVGPDQARSKATPGDPSQAQAPDPAQEPSSRSIV